MNKTKKITNLHDYSKEVDKIIATKKPIVEQFMDLMGLMDVTFIDENQTSNRRLNKQDKSVQDKQPEKSKTERDKKNPVRSVLDKKPSTGKTDWRDKYLDKFKTTPHKGIEDFITELLNKKKRLKKTLKSSQNEVFGIGGKVDRFFLSGDDITLFSAKQFIRKLFADILKHNKDDMTGLYDYDGIAEEVINLVKK